MRTYSKRFRALLRHRDSSSQSSDMLYLSPYCRRRRRKSAQLAEERRRRAVLKSATNYIRLRILLYLCPHTTMCVSSYILPYVRPHTITSVPSYYYMCVLILLYMCPRTAICVLILLYVSSYYCLCPHTNFVVFNTTQKFHCGPLY